MTTDTEINEKLKARGVAGYMREAGRQGLIDRWRSFIEEVEQGYTVGLDDYRNDLDLREIIEYAGLGADPEILALDARFQAQLVRTEKKIWRSDYPHAFWIYGYPKKVSEGFRSDVEHG